MIEYKLLFEKIIERKFKARLRKGSRIEYIYYTDFFDTYLIWQAEDVWYKINYYDISKAIETDTNFYLVYGGMLLVFQKNSCGLNLINFLKTKFNNTENYVRS